MGTMRLLIPFLLVSVVSSAPQKPHQPPRPTRTLGSLFGSSKPATPPPNQPPQVVNEQKSLNSVPQPISNVRPLVYQVKYYDRVQNNLIDYQDSRYPIDKAGLEVPHQVVQGNVPQGVVVGQPPYIPQRYYYNPLIPQQQDQLVYTIAQVGNTQVLIPCTTQDYPYDTQVALNVENYRPQPPAQSTSPQPQRTPLPPQPQQQPLVRDQVIAAAQELTTLNALPGTAVVGANVNTVPYTQGSYFYYYLIPPTLPQQQAQIQDQVQRIQPYTQPYTPPYTQPYQYVRYNGLQPYQNYPVVPVVLGGYPVNQPVQVPQQSSPVPVRTQATTQPVQQTQQQQQQQTVKG